MNTFAVVERLRAVACSGVRKKISIVDTKRKFLIPYTFGQVERFIRIYTILVRVRHRGVALQVIEETIVQRYPMNSGRIRVDND
jgi:hypothetical protein